MSWSSAVLRWGALLLGVVLLGACGFEPLYAQRENAEAVSELSAIKVQRIEDRNGQQLRNYLLDRLNPHGQAEKELYSLYVTLVEDRQDLAIRKDETATRANLIMTARFVLVEIESGVRLLESVSSVTTSFNIVRSEFATLTGENDARRRGVREISDEIRTRLALYFNGRHRPGS